MSKVKGFIRSIDISQFGAGVVVPEVRVELSLTEGDIYVLVEHMNSNQPIEIEMPEKGWRVAKRESLEKPRIWRLIEVEEE